MKTIVKKRPKIQKLREVFEYDQQYILQNVTQTELDYFKLVYQTGLEFLNEIYPEGSTFEKYFRMIERSSEYWNWWKSEWKKWQNDLINHCNQAQASLDEGFWRSEMQILAHDPATEVSFYTFLKSSKYEF